MKLQEPQHGRLALAALVRARAAELSPDLRNWISVGLAAAFAFPSRVPPRGGLFGRRAGRFPVRLKFRNGYRLHCRLDELEGYYAAFVERQYENATADWAGVRSILDVGANVGAASLWFAHRAPLARIIAVEPNPDAFARLMANIVRSGLRSRVTPVGAALGSSPGLATIIQHRWSVATTTVPGFAAGEAIVGQVSLEQLFGILDFDHLDILKLDCEGAEYESLLAVPVGVLHRIGAVVVECHSVPGRVVQDLEGYLRGAGFSVLVAANSSQLGLLTATRSRQPTVPESRKPS